MKVLPPSFCASEPITPSPTHIDDIAVDQLANAMKAKLASCRAAGRRGWDSPLACSIERLAQMMGEALCKGDPIDVANFAAFLLARGAAPGLIAEHAMRAFLRGSRNDQSARIAELQQELLTLKNKES